MASTNFDTLLGKTQRLLGTRVKEHRSEVDKISGDNAFHMGEEERSRGKCNRRKSAITNHVLREKYIIDWESARMAQKESDW